MASTVLRLGAQRLAQELLEEEVTDLLGRERYVRHRGAEAHHRVTILIGYIAMIGRLQDI